jgi:hypothetical protein
VVSGPLPLAAVQRSKAPLIIVGLGALAVLALGGYVFLKPPAQAVAPIPEEPKLAEVKPPVPLDDDAGAVAAAVKPDGPAGKLIDLKDDPPVLMEVKKTAELFSEGGDTFVKVGNGAGLKPGQTVAVLGPAKAQNIYPLLGHAVVKQVFSKLTLVTLDEAAASGTAQKLIALTPLKPYGAPPAANEPKTLKGYAELISSNPKGKSVRVSNDGAVGWSKCTLSVPGQLSFSLGSLAPRFTREVLLSQFKPDRSAPKLSNEVAVKCAEGLGRFAAK